MIKIYNKLVRDNIPEIIIKDNCRPITRVLSDKEYKVELEKKLLEEYYELVSAKTKEERIEELADLLEIIQALAVVDNKTLADVNDVASKKRLKRGGFEKKIFLEKVVENK